MDLTTYILFLGISLSFIVLGYALKGEADIFKYIGFGFLFTLGLLLVPGTPGDLDIKIGETSLSTEPTVNSTQIVTTYNTEIYTSSFYGFYISILGIFGLINTFVLTKVVKTENGK